MKVTLIKKIFIFVLPLLVLAIGAELYARSIPNSYKYKSQWMDMHKDSVKTIILGNSHLLGFDPSLLDNAFNLTNSSQNLEYDNWLLKKYLGKCPNLSLIILSVDYHNLFAMDYEETDAADWNRAMYYNLYMDYPKHGVLSPYHYELSCSRFMLKKLFGYTCALVLKKRYDIGIDSLGRKTPQMKDNEGNEKKLSFYSIKREVKKESIDKNRNILSQNIIYLNSIIDNCKSHNIRLLIVSAPFWHIYNENIDIVRLKLCEDSINAIINRNKVEWANYRDSKEYSYVSRYFKDGQHLSDIGSHKFTLTIKRKYCLE